MGKYLRISSYIRKPFLICDFASNCYTLNFPIQYMRKIYFLFYQCTYSGAEMFVDPFSLILQSVATPLDSDMEASPRWRIYGSWMCGHPRPGPCEESFPLPSEHRAIERGRVWKGGMWWLWTRR
jgi:hypothetical protein